MLKQQLSSLYHQLIPAALRRDLWYRRNTGQGYAASLPPRIALPAAIEAPIHEVIGPDLLIFSAHPWEELPQALCEQVLMLQQQGYRIFIIGPNSKNSHAQEVAVAPGLWSVSLPHTIPENDSAQAAWLTAVEHLREQYTLVTVFCLFLDRRFAMLQTAIETRWHWPTQLASDPSVDINSIIGLALPQHFPTVTIIILAYNNPFYLQLTLKSVLEKTRYPYYDVLVVDNASADETQRLLDDLARKHPRIRVIHNEHNVGFAGGINVGLQAAVASDVMVLLNDDVIVTPGWLTTLVGYLKDLSVGLVGPVTSFTSNAARIPIRYKGIDDIDAFAKRYTSQHAGETFAVEMFPMFCVALRRETIDAIGPLDERFKYGMFEDDDYAARLHEHGYRIICARDAFVHHFGGTSFTKLEDERFKKIFADNRQAFEEKWQRAWTAPRR